MRLTVKSLSFSFDDQNPIFNQLNLEINPGDYVTIQGISVGKSLLFKILLRIVEYSEGDILYDGKLLKRMNNIELTELRKKLGYMPQLSGLFPNLTIYENLSLPLQYHTRLSSVQISKIVFEYLEKIEQDKYCDKRPDFFSNSQIRMFDFIRAIILDPEMVFLDEPAEDLSEKDFKFFTDFLIERIKKETAFLITITPTSRLPFYESRSDYYLSNGSLLQLQNKEGIVY